MFDHKDTLEGKAKRKIYHFQSSYLERIQSLTNAASLVFRVGYLKGDIFDAANDYYKKRIQKGDDPRATLIRYLHHIELLFDKYKYNDIYHNVSIGRWLAKADAYLGLSKSRKEKSCKKNFGGYDWQQTVTPLASFSDSQLIELIRTGSADKDEWPEWYVYMQNFEKVLFQETFGSIISVNLPEKQKLNALRAKAIVIPSPLRTIPGLPNFYRVSTQIGGREYTVWRSSIVSSRDLPQYQVVNDYKLMALRKKYALDNIQHLLQEMINHRNLSIEEFINIPILLGTLVTDLPGADKDVYIDKKEACDYIKKNGIELSFKGKAPVLVTPQNLFTINHPLNMGRYVKNTNGPLGSGDTATSIKNLLESHIIKDEVLREEIKKVFYNEYEYDEALEYAVKRNRELHIAALLEVAVSNENGLVQFSCVSGKDRKGIHAIYVDAIRIYYQIYEIYPKLDDPADLRKNFVDIFVSLYFTRFQENLAGENSLGCNGLKSMASYCPADIQEAIEKFHIQQSNELAHNNDFAKLLAKYPNNEFSRTVKSGTGIGALTGFCLSSIMVLILFVVLQPTFLAIMGIAVFLVAMSSLAGTLLGSIIAAKVALDEEVDFLAFMDRSLDAAQRNQGFQSLTATSENLDYAALHQGYDAQDDVKRDQDNDGATLQNASMSIQ